MRTLIALVFLIPQPQESKIAAKINLEIITWDEVDTLIKDIDKSKDPELRKATLVRLAENKLFLQEAKKNDIKVKKEEINRFIDEQIKRVGGKEKFEDYLRVRSQTLTQYMEEIEVAIFVNKLITHKYYEWYLNGNGPIMMELVGPQEIREFYDKNIHMFRTKESMGIWRIALQFNESEKEYREKLAHSLRNKSVNGHNFMFLLLFYSDIKTRGPITITRESSIFSKENTDKIFALAEGQISEVFIEGNTINFVNIVKKIEKKDMSFEYAQLVIKSELENQKRNENRRSLRNYLVEKAYIWPEDLFK